MAATVWEVRGVLSELGFSQRDSRTYQRKDPDLILRLTGMGQSGARQGAEALLRDSPGMVISTGFAGALKEEIRPGDLVIDTARSDPKWAQVLSEIAEKNLVPAHGGPFYSSKVPLMTALEKARTARETGAVAVEMESQAIFEVLKLKQVPFLSFRTVSDSLDQDLPPAIFESSPGPGLLWRLLLAPGQWGSFAKLVRSSRAAEKSLTKIFKEFIQHV